MLYFPFLDFFDKYQKHFYSFAFYLGAYLLLYIADLFLSHFFGLLAKFLLLPLALTIYIVSFVLIRQLKLKIKIGSLFDHGLGYVVLFALVTYWFYILMVRRRMGISP